MDQGAAGLSEREPFLEQLSAVLGASASDPRVAALKATLGIQADPIRMEQLAFLECPDLGVSLAFKDDIYLSTGGQRYRKDGPVTLVGIHLYSEGRDGYREYRRDLPWKIRFRDDRASVHIKAGRPTAMGGGNRALGKVWPLWDRYDLDAYSVRVEYGGDQPRVELITLMAPSEIAGIT